MVQPNLAVLTLLAAASSVSGYRFSGWSENSFQGREVAYTTSGTHKLGFNCHSYIYQSAIGDGCCIKFCKNSKPTGYRCGSYENTDVAAGNVFNKVVLGCGDDVLNC